MNLVRFQVLTAESIKMTVFWVVALCSLAEIYRCLTVFTASIIRTIAQIYQNKRRKVSEVSHLKINLLRFPNTGT
jgi:hypothetical protein